MNARILSKRKTFLKVNSSTAINLKIKNNIYFIACKKGVIKDVENYIKNVNAKDVNGEFPLFIGI